MKKSKKHSTLPETYDTLMDGAKANMVLTDPPYNVNVEETAGKIKNDNMADEDFYNFLFAAFVNMEHAMEADASIYVFHADTEGLNFRKAFAAAGFYLSGCCIWKKNALVLGRSPYQWQHEPCLYGWKKGGNVYEEVPMGVFFVAEANRKIRTLELKAYDAMLNLEKNFNKGLSSAFPYDFLSLLSKACHVELAQTKEEIEALTNGTELLAFVACAPSQEDRIDSSILRDKLVFWNLNFCHLL